METKLFEIRDKGTFIPIMCVQLGSRNEAERYLLARAGYGPDSYSQREYVMMISINGGSGPATSDEYKWGNRTRKNAHAYIRDHWDELTSGDVIDVEFILGETKEKKRSESETAFA